MLGCSSKGILTLMKARKTSTNNMYAKVWDKFKVFSVGKGADPSSPSTSLLLYFLQKGLDLGLGLRTLKIQVAIISATDKGWA